MLELGTSGQNELKLAVLGYQFPDITGDYWDSNWLYIYGRATIDGGKWSFRDSCLTTFELRSLERWFEALARRAEDGEVDRSSRRGLRWLRRAGGKHPEQETWFTEPNLRFAWIDDEDGVTIRVGFALESAPPWATEGEYFNSELTLALACSADDLRAATRALSDMCQRYPIRASSRQLRKRWR